MDFERILLKKERYEQSKSKIDSITLSTYEKDFELRFTHNSTAIEGNTLTLAETKVLLEDGVSVGGKELREIYEGSNIDGFTCVGDGQTRTGNKMNQPEPMISEYNLHTWMNPNANSNGDPNVKNTPITAERYRGLTRL